MVARPGFASVSLHQLRTFNTNKSFGEISNFAAYGLAPASVVSPLGVFSVISNCVILPLLFDKTPHIETVTGTVIAMPGILLLILAAPSLSVPPDGPQFGPIVTPYIVANLVACIGLAFARLLAKNDPAKQFFPNVGMCALMGSFSVLAIKGMSLSIVGHHKEISAPMCLLIFLGTTILQFSILIDTLQHFAMHQVIPHHFIMFTALVTIGSNVLFHEFSISTSVAKIEFAFGALLSIVGVLISARPHEHQRKLSIAMARRRSSVATIHSKARVVLDSKPRRRRDRRRRKRRNGPQSTPTPGSSELFPDHYSVGRTETEPRPHPDTANPPSPTEHTPLLGHGTP